MARQMDALATELQSVRAAHARTEGDLRQQVGVEGGSRGSQAHEVFHSVRDHLANVC